MLKRTVAGIVLSIGMCCGAVHAEKPATVWVGSAKCFYVRVADGKRTPQQCVDGVQDVLIKHLGGSKGRFTTKPAGSKVNLYLNGEYLIAATPEDAAAAKQKTAATLAAAWKSSLEKGFEATKAVR